VKNHDLRQKILFFPILGGVRVRARVRVKVKVRVRVEARVRIWCSG
jgi:hypothetical protein